ncbi:MAG TPA: hypothetical protein DIT07_01350 [Sphingobacteriaceae bacterium]|nr:hypothetical protein [Sphingobacteriaceae bacterium]
MKELFLIEDSVDHKISYYHLLLFFMSLPFDRFYSLIILLSFMVHTLIHFKKSDLKKLKNPDILILQLVYLLTMIGTIYTNNHLKAFQDWDRHLAILLFPIIMAVSSLDLNKYKKKLIEGLAISCVLTILYLYFDAISIIKYDHLPLSDLISESFINYNFSSPIQIHPTYLSIFVAFSLIYFLTEFFKATSKKERIIHAIAIIILLAGLIQLCSRSVFIATILIVNIAVPFSFYRGNKRIILLIYTVLLSLGALIIISQIQSLRSRYFTDFKKDLIQSPVIEITDPRIARWDAALSIIKQAPISGYGTGSEIDVLGNEFFARKLYHSYLHQLNAHNQYLSFILKFGITGLIVYLSTLFYGFRIALRRKDLLFFSFMILITIVSFSENILDVNKGIIFYSSFFSLFVFSKNKAGSRE